MLSVPIRPLSWSEATGKPAGTAAVCSTFRAGLAELFTVCTEYVTCWPAVRAVPMPVTVVPPSIRLMEVERSARGWISVSAVATLLPGTGSRVVALTLAVTAIEGPAAGAGKLMAYDWGVAPLAWLPGTVTSDSRPVATV